MAAPAKPNRLEARFAALKAAGKKAASNAVNPEARMAWA